MSVYVSCILVQKIFCSYSDSRSGSFFTWVLTRIPIFCCPSEKFNLGRLKKSEDPGSSWRSVDVCLEDQSWRWMIGVFRQKSRSPDFFYVCLRGVIWEVVLPYYELLISSWILYSRFGYPFPVRVYCLVCVGPVLYIIFRAAFLKAAVIISQRFLWK